MQSDFFASCKPQAYMFPGEFQFQGSTMIGHLETKTFQSHQHSKAGECELQRKDPTVVGYPLELAEMVAEHFRTSAVRSALS